jgi:NAD(P)-dependent dehydrogenase (short-subunit alcohol dehydrogenase family)
MAEKFAGKVALVAGGTGGLGRAMSLAFLAQGATVVATYRRQDEWDALQKTAAANRQNLSGLSVDVTDESAVATLAGNLVAKFGRLDALVNSVGAYAGGVKLWELDAKVWDQMFALNLRSDFVLARAAVPQMLKQREGSIVNIASKAAVGHAAGAAAYAASKAAAVAMIDSLALT